MPLYLKCGLRYAQTLLLSRTRRLAQIRVCSLSLDAQSHPVEGVVCPDGPGKYLKMIMSAQSALQA